MILSGQRGLNNDTSCRWSIGYSPEQPQRYYQRKEVSEEGVGGCLDIEHVECQHWVPCVCVGCQEWVDCGCCEGFCHQETNGRLKTNHRRTRSEYIDNCPLFQHVDDVTTPDSRGIPCPIRVQKSSQFPGQTHVPKGPKCRQESSDNPEQGQVERYLWPLLGYECHREENNDTSNHCQHQLEPKGYPPILLADTPCILQILPGNIWNL